REEDGIFFAEPDFFEIFDFPLLTGDYKALKDPNNVLLTKETADRYFGDWHLATGKVFKIGNSFFSGGNTLYKVVGVMAAVPNNTDFQIKMVVSYCTRKNFTESKDWRSVASNHCCYILLPAGTSPASFDQQLAAFGKKYKEGDDNTVLSHYLQPI